MECCGHQQHPVDTAACVTYSIILSGIQVAGSEQEESRLLLCHATAVVMRQVLRILGITPLNRI